MVQAIARQTFSSKSNGEALESFTARLQAMGAANALLLKDSWQAAPLQAVIESCIAPFRDARVDQFIVSGPRVVLSSGAAMALGMALHELCTNAAKYGALSTEAGQVHIVWAVSRGRSADQFFLTWTEKNGPLVEAPSRTGFGSKLITQILEHQIGGKVELTYAPDGVVCAILASVAAIQATAPAVAA